MRKAINGLAQENTPRLLGGNIATMSNVVKEITEDTGELFQDTGMQGTCVPMYVLSNEAKLNGASTMLYDGILKAFAKMVGGSFYTYHQVSMNSYLFRQIRE